MYAVDADTGTQALVAVAAVVGHMFPVWLGVRGGTLASGVPVPLEWTLTMAPSLDPASSLACTK